MASGVLCSASDCSPESVLAMSNGGELLLMMKTAFGCGKKNRDRVREVRRVAGEREGPKGRGPAHRSDRNRRKCGGGRADSGDKIRRPGGALGVRVRGKWVRGRRGFYRRPELSV